MTIAQTTVAEFCIQVGGNEPVPAGVSISSVSAALALSLLAKVLDIASKRKDFRGDRDRVEALMNSAREESKGLTELADRDVLAFNQYLECIRSGGNKDDAMGKCIDVPMQAGRAVIRGLELCAAGTEIVKGLTVADLAISADILLGTIRGMLVSVDFNLKQLGPEHEIAQRVLTERRELELRAVRLDDLITTAVRSHLS